MKFSPKNAALFIFIFFIFLLLSVYITYPLIWHLGSVTTGYGDELTIAWIHTWVIHALTTNPFSLFDANIYYPFQNTLAFSDHFFTSAILSYPALLLFREPIVTINFTLISSLVLVPFSLFLLSYYVTRDLFASFLAGILFLFSPATLDKRVHVQILALQWIPLSVLCFLLFMKIKKTRYLFGAASFFLLQTYNNFMSGYFLVFFYLIFTIYYWFRDRSKLYVFLKKINITLIIVTFLLTLLVTIPYYKVSRQFNYVRDIRDSIHFALQPEDLLYPSEYTRFQPLLLSLSDSMKYTPKAMLKPGYLGLAFSILSISLIIYAFKKRKKTKDLFNIFLLSGFFGIILSLGPFLHFGRVTIHNPFPIPLPYAILYYVAPGFQGFRNSARFEMMFILFVSVAIGIMLSEISKKYSPKLRILFYTVLILGIIFEYNSSLRFYPIVQTKNFPAVYRWLATTPKDTKVIIMPIYNWSDGGVKEMERQYLSTFAFRKMVNGASGFSPPPWQSFVQKLNKYFPKNEAVQSIRNLGVTYIIVNKKDYEEDFRNHKSLLKGDYVVKTLIGNPSVSLVKQFGDYYVFAFK